MIRLYIGWLLIIGLIGLRYLQIKNPLSYYLPKNNIEMNSYRRISNNILDSIAFTMMIFVLGVYLVITSIMEINNIKK